MRRVLVAVAVIMSVLVITAPVAADHTVVATQTTDSDFVGGTLTNSEVVRSGVAGSVSHDTHEASAVARYALDYGSGSTAFDHAGSNDGSISGATWTSGVRGSGLSFDPTDTVDTGIQTNFQSSFSVSAFVRITNRNSTSKRIISDDENGNGWALTYGDAGVGTLRFFIRGMDTTSLNTGDVIAENTWYHVTAIYDAETNTRWILVDGNVVASLQSDTGTPPTDAGPIRLGSAVSNGQGINGDIDEARVFGESLTPGEAARLADAPATKQSPTAAERFALDAGQGSTAFADGGPDASISGNPTWEPGVSGQALNFSADGTADKISAPSSAATNVSGTNGITVTGWIKSRQTQASGAAYWLTKGKFPGNYFFSVETTGAGIFRVSDLSGTSYAVSAGSLYDANSWTFVAGRYNPSTGELSIFKNGAKVSSTNIGDIGTLYQSNTPIQSGTQSGDAPNFAIDDLRVIKRALTDAEIQFLFEHPSAQLPETSSYQSPSASVTDPTEVEIDTSLLNATANATVIADGGQTLGSASISSSGTTTIPLSGSASGAHVEVDFSTSDPDHYARVDAIRYRVESAPPVIDNSSLSPNTTAQTIDTQPTLEATFSDSDETTQQGDSYTAEWYVDGSLVDTTNHTSDGTISTTFSSISAGEHTWYVEITDSYGHTQTSATAEFATPSELLIYNESAPSTLVDNTTLRVRFFEDGKETVMEKSVTNGSVDLTGLPVGSRLVVTVNDQNTKFEYRRIVLESIFNQGEVYLLPKSADSAAINFQLDDATGRFPASETTLYVEKPITKDFDNDSVNETKYRVIAGDNFGASQDFPATLALNERYRLRVENADGETRVLGSYTATKDAVESIPIGQVTFQGSADSGPAIDAKIVTQNDGSRDIRITYRDAEKTTGDLTIGVHAQGNESNVLQPNTTYAGPHGTLVVTYDVPANAPDDVAYEVDFYTTLDGEPLTATRFVGDVPELAANWNIDPQVLSLMGWTLVLGLTGLTVIYSPRIASIVGVVTAGFVAAIGATAIPVPVLALAGSVALLWNIAGGTPT